jgi:uncharacterized protein (DUF433 family)
MIVNNIININPNILGGTPVFDGTRVPIKNLFDYLETGESLEEFLDDFPSVTKDQAISLLIAAQKLLTASKEILNENIA